MKNPQKPLIGIILDRLEGSVSGYAKFPWYALRENYAKSISNAGGIPIFLPYDFENIPYYVQLISGLIIPGGDFDIDPEYYGQKPHPKTSANKYRTQFEFSFLKAFFPTFKPIFGICGGEQLINVFCGGTLIQHIPDIHGTLNHEQKIPKNEVFHKITIEPNTKLASIIGKGEFMTNSTHHQGIDKLGAELVASAYCLEDNIIEAIEHINHPFCLGAQWHPEYESTSEDTKLFKSFINACR